MSQITQKGATGIALQAGGSFQATTDANVATMVGTRWDLEDGREVILVGTSTATTTTAGQLYQDAALVANHQNVTVAAFTAYSANGNIPAQVSLGTNATATTANQYQGGYLIVNAGTGIGQTLLIASNPVITSATAGVITLEDGPNVALDTTSKVCLVPAHGANIIINPTTPSNVPVGIGLYPIAVSSYGFLVSKGVTSALSDSGAPGVGKAICPSTVTAGTIGAATISTPIIGYTAIAAVSAEARTVFVNV